MREGHRVTACEFDADAATLDVACRTTATSAGACASARWSTPPAGTGLLAKKFGLRTDEPRLANIAIFSHFSGVPRRAPATGRTTSGSIARNDAGWFWVIPISRRS